MRKATAVLCLVSLGMFSCASLPPREGGTLVVSEKTPMDGFFLMGNLDYVRKNLKVSYYADSKAPTVSNLVLIYENKGEDGIRLKTQCCWADLTGTCFSGAKTWGYDTYLLPYSKYVVRTRAVKPAQSQTQLVCDHMETFADLWNNPSNIRE